jgi:hypothetical protein
LDPYPLLVVVLASAEAQDVEVLVVVTAGVQGLLACRGEPDKLAAAGSIALVVEHTEPEVVVPR